MFIVNFIRLLISLLAGGLVLLVGLLVHAVTWVIGRWDTAACDRIRWKYVRAAVRLIWFLCGGKTTTIGLENVPTDRPFLLVGNHRSILDIVLTLSQLPVPVGFVAKQELEKVPVLRVLMRDIHCLFLNRQDPREGLKTILAAIDQLKGGLSMAIYPEGTRCKEEGTMLPFHAGSFKPAFKTGVPIVPVTIVNMGDVFEDHLPWLHYVPVVIEYSKPIETASLDRKAQKELPDRLREEMLEIYARNDALIHPDKKD